MTSQEAQKRVDQCENAIVSAYRSLHAEAQNIVFNVEKAASGYTSAATLLPLIISIIGLLLIFTKHYIGILPLIAGIFIAVKARQSASYTESNVKKENGYLQGTLDNNKSI